jgi:copper chaperone NosL
MTDLAPAADRPHAVRSRPRLLDSSIGALPRALLVAAALCLALTWFFPLWNLTMFAPQYPDGLRLHIYSHELAGGNGGQDVREINVLNHYIGMRDLQASDFTEFQWMPFVLGALGLLFLRAAVHGQLAQLLDVFVMSLYFSAFSLWSFGYKLYRYGHDLAPTAAVRVEPFMPPMFGHKKLANFDVYSYPALGSYALGAVMALLALAFFLAWRRARGRAAEA